METKTVNIINFYDLDPEWQTEAISNLDDFAIEALYFEPEEAHNPAEHILWDLSEAMPATGNHICEYGAGRRIMSVILETVSL